MQQTREARWISAVTACGPGAVLSHLDVAALWKIYDSRRSKIHVTTTRSPRRLPGIRAHRARPLDAADVTVRDGIPVTTVARTLVDLTDVLGRDRVLRAIREAEYLKLLDLDTLIAAVQRANGRRRLSVLNAALGPPPPRPGRPRGARAPLPGAGAHSAPARPADQREGPDQAPRIRGRLPVARRGRRRRARRKGGPREGGGLRGRSCARCRSHGHRAAPAAVHLAAGGWGRPRGDRRAGGHARSSEGRAWAKVICPR
jgi:hypothetical protein